MSNPALEFVSVTKRYPPASAPNRGLSKLLRRDDRPGTVALEDVTFAVEPGHSLALIGDNGAGKTTALRLATRLTLPTTGVVRTTGRVAALVAVTSGLHLELTGRENIGLYARILGLGSAMLRKRLADIIDFADIGDAIDQPVKQYSSGMQLRLGFAISANVEPDVFIVDEVIAVGDAAFQERCARRMRELRDAGSTLVMVSHSMSSVEDLCERAIRLDQGRVVDEGPSREVVDRYLQRVRDEISPVEPTWPIVGAAIELVGMSLHDATGRKVDAVRVEEPVTVRVAFNASDRLSRPHFTVGFYDDRHGCFQLATMLSDGGAPDAVEGGGYVDCAFDALPFRPRDYMVWASVRDRSLATELVPWQPVGTLPVVDADGTQPQLMAYDLPVAVRHEWSVRVEVDSP